MEGWEGDARWGEVVEGEGVRGGDGGDVVMSCGR